MKRHYYLVFIFFLIGMMKVQAQSTIGAATQPQDFSILELISGNSEPGGLRMPQLTENERNALTNSAAFQAEIDGKALGLTIYNKTNDCIEYWNGTKWVSRCQQGSCCAAPSSPCPISFNFSSEPLKLGDTFTASVVPIAELTYAWTVPSSVSIEGSSFGSSITIKAITPGTHLLSGINVTATNSCGSSSVCSGSGSMHVLNCSKAPELSDINSANIKVEYAESGTGTAADPYVMLVGNTIKISYENSNSSIYYAWSLSAEGQNYFEQVSSGDGVIVLRAKNYNVGTACSAGAILLTLRNDCGLFENQASRIIVKTISSCVQPAAPGPISAPTTVYENQTFTVNVPEVSGVSYSWKLSDALKTQVDVVSGDNTSTIALHAKVPAGTSINLSGLTVTAYNSCGYIETTGTASVYVVALPSETGKGVLQGKYCFDIAYSNNNAANGFINNEREYQRTNFSNRTVQDQEAGTTVAEYSGVQVYTFTTSGAVSNVRFVLADSKGVVQSYIPAGDYSGTLTSGTKCKLTVSFDPELNTRLRGVTRTESWTVDVFAIYHDGVSDKTVKLTLYLRDASCCGAATKSGGWLVFMCHNLGVNQNIDPFVENESLFGDIYQWGRPKDGHQVKNSVKTNTLATNQTATAPSSVKGLFIVPCEEFYDWLTGNYPNSGNPGTTRWGNGTENLSPTKANNDPCPAGWKLPSQKQWASIFLGNQNYNTRTAYANNTNTANTWTWKKTGVQVGNELYLPAAGRRAVTETENGTWKSSSEIGHYWSSTIILSNSAVYKLASGLFFDNTEAAENANNYRSYGLSVRCVADDTYTP